MIKLEFNINKFNDSIKNIKQEKVLTDTEVKAHDLISIISDYIDCEAATIMNLTEETLDRAMSIVTNDINMLHSMQSTSKMSSLTRTTRTQKIVTQADLF